MNSENIKGWSDGSKSPTILEIYTSRNKKADINEERLLEEQRFYQALRKEVFGHMFAESNLSQEDCPTFESGVYFIIARESAGNIIDLCELGSYIGVDLTTKEQYKNADAHLHAVTSFVVEAKAIKDTIFLEHPAIDKAIDHLEDIVKVVEEFKDRDL
jgi:hypothetical protein